MDTALLELEILSTEFIRLQNEKQVLLDWGKPQLEALYLLHVGELQIKRLNAQLQIMALKRKIELVTAAINTGQLPDILSIDVAVAMELVEAEQKISNATREYAMAIVYARNLESPARSIELRKVYCRLAKKLHPDVNPTLTEWQAELWLKVLKAYEEGDLDQLLALELVYKDELHMETVIDEATAVSQAEKLRQAIVRLETEIAMIRGQFPFTHEILLYDDDWIRRQRESLQIEIDNLRILERQLNDELESLLS